MIIWQEINNLKEEIRWLKERVNDLECADLTILHEAIIIRNKGTLQNDLNSLMFKIKKLVQKYGQVELTITSD